jgi:hypothetical protein
MLVGKHGRYRLRRGLGNFGGDQGCDMKILGGCILEILGKWGKVVGGGVYPHPPGFAALDAHEILKFATSTRTQA